MKRSEINEVIAGLKRICSEQQFPLPPWASFTPDDWREQAEEWREVIDTGLGYDVTDFGLGRYREVGLALVTLRNGSAGDPSRYPKPYCEKLLLVGEEQVTPAHHHRLKREDIIVRGGGVLMVELRNASPDGELLDTPVSVNMDGHAFTVDAGAIVEVRLGASITLPPYLHHRFWGKPNRGHVFCIEVSTVNCDRTDNVFIPDLERFSHIEEDEAPTHLLCNEYRDHLRAELHEDPQCARCAG